MTNALSEAAHAFEEQLEELGLSGTDVEGVEPAELGRRGALLAAADTLWRRRLELLDGDHVQTLLGVTSRQAVHALVKRRRLLAVPSSDRGSLYPSFQFGPDGRPFAQLPDVLRAFEGAAIKPHTLASWFITPLPILENKTPAEWLREGGDRMTLLTAARRSSLRLAH